MFDFFDVGSGHGHAQLLLDLTAAAEHGPHQAAHAEAAAHLARPEQELDAFLLSTSSLSPAKHGGSSDAEDRVSTFVQLFASQDDDALFFEPKTIQASAQASAFDASHFKIHPKDLGGDAHDIALAIKGGYGAGKAIALLEKAAGKADVSFDQMLSLTEHELEGMKGKAADAGEKAFEAEMKARLGDGSAAHDLAALIDEGHLSAKGGAQIIVVEAHAATPGDATEAHALATLMGDMSKHGVAEKQVEAVAAAHAKLILAGIEDEIDAGGKLAPKGVDVAAAAEVLEAQLGKFSDGALAKFQKLCADLDDTAQERAVLAKMEAAALAEAVAEKQISAAMADRWDAALNPPKPDKISQQVYQIANELKAGEISDFDAAQKMSDLAQSTWVPGHVPPGAGDLMVKAVGFETTPALAAALAKLASACFDNGTLYGSAANPIDAILDKLVTGVAARAEGGSVDIDAFCGVLRVAMGYLTTTEAEARAVLKAIVGKVDEGDKWLLSLEKATGGFNSGTAPADVGGIRALLAVSDVMNDRVFTGKLAAAMAKQYENGDVTLAKASDFMAAYAAVAVDNAGYDSINLALFVDGDLTQADGVAADDRVALAYANFFGKLDGADAKAAQAYFTKAKADEFIAGLALQSVIGGSQMLADNLMTAREVIYDVGHKAVVDAAHQNNAAAVQAAEQAAGEMSGIFDAAFKVGVNAAFTLGDVPGAGLAFATAAALADPGNFQQWVDVGAAALLEYAPANPLAEALVVSDLATLLLDKTGLGELLGPVGDAIEGVVSVVHAVGDAIDKTIQGFANAAVDLAVTTATVTVVDLANNIADLTTSLASGDFGGAADAAEALVVDLGTDIANSIAAFADTVVVNAFDAIKEGGQAILDTINSTVDPIIDTLTPVVQPIFDGVFAVVEFFSGGGY